MVISKECPVPRINILLDGEEVKQVNQMVYLGQLISDDGRNDKDIERRLSIARATFIKLRGVLTNFRTDGGNEKACVEMLYLVDTIVCC